jgi:hypothetical protein
LHNEELHKLVSFAKKNCNDRVKEDEMGRAFSTYGSEQECMQDFGGKARRKETTK